MIVGRARFLSVVSALTLLAACAQPAPAAPGRRAEPPPAPPLAAPPVAPAAAAATAPVEPGVPTPSPAQPQPSAPPAPPTPLQPDNPTAPTADSHFTVDAQGTLTFVSPGKTRTVDRRVIDEIAVSPDRSTVAYPRRTPAAGSEIVTNSVIGEFAQVVSPGLRDARMPAFTGVPSRVIFWARERGQPVLGLYVADPRVQPAQPRRVTNVGVAGERDPRFVPPPSDFRSLRVEPSGRVTYRARTGTITAALPPAAPMP